MEHDTHENGCGKVHDCHLVQDVEDLIQGVKDEIAMEELNCTDRVINVQDDGLEPRIGLQRFRIA